MDSEWFNRYPRPINCIHDNVTEITGDEFQELLQSYKKADEMDTELLGTLDKVGESASIDGRDDKNTKNSGAAQLNTKG